MNLSHFSSKEIEFWQDRVFSSCDSIYQVALFLSLNPNQAAQMTFSAFQECQNKLNTVMKSKNPLLLIAKEIWTIFAKNSSHEKPMNDPSHTQLTSFIHLQMKERAILAFVDILGLTTSEATLVLSWSEDEAYRVLSQARKKLLQPSS